MLEGVFSKDSLNELKTFLKQYKYPYYNIRDKSKSMGDFLYKITEEEVIKNSYKYDKFSVYESLAEADKNLILQGDIFISKDFELCASLSDVKGISNRVAMQEPKYHIRTDLKENREPYIYGLKKVIDYVITNCLFDVYVEFSLFDIPVGINKENILIWELRNY